MYCKSSFLSNSQDLLILSYNSMVSSHYNLLSFIQ
jgi:hypothetical protein